MKRVLDFSKYESKVVYHPVLGRSIRIYYLTEDQLKNLTSIGKFGWFCIFASGLAGICVSRLFSYLVSSLQ